MTTDTTRNAYKKAVGGPISAGGDSLMGYLLSSMNNNLDDLDNNTALANWEAVTDPTVTDDSADGYSKGSPWLNKTLNKLFACLDATVGAAVWALVYPSAAMDYSDILTELGDIPYWNGVNLSPIHHATKGYALVSGGHGAAPEFSDSPVSGWTALPDTLLYSSAADPIFTLMVAGDLTATYRPDCKLRLYQGGSPRYFKILRSFCIGSNAPSINTYIVVDGGGSQTLENSNITTPFISQAACPHGFPLALEKQGWTGINEAVAYSSWDATIHAGAIIATGADLTDRIRIATKVRFWQSTSIRYGIVTGLVYAGGNTTITVYFGNDYTLTNFVISEFTFSQSKCPSGFPVDPKRWEFSFFDITNRSQSSPAQNTVYNIGGEKYDLPPGSWKVRIDYMDYAATSTTGGASMNLWLDMQANGSGDNIIGSESATLANYCYGMIWGTAGGNVIFLTKTTVYMCMMSRSAGQTLIQSWSRYFTLECMYL